MGLTTNKLKTKLREVIDSYRKSFVRELHNKAKNKIEKISDEMKQIQNNVSKSPDSIDNLVNIMKEIKHIVKQEMDMEERIKPVLEMYKLLSNFSEEEEIPAAEQEIKNNIEKDWKELCHTASNT